MLSSLDSNSSKALVAANDHYKLLVDLKSIVNDLDTRTSMLETVLTSQHRLQLDHITHTSTLKASSSHALHLLETQQGLLQDVRSSSRTSDSTMANMESLLTLQDSRQMSKLEDIEKRLSGTFNQQNLEHDSLTMVLQGTQQLSLGIYNLLASFVAYLMKVLVHIVNFLPQLNMHIRIMLTIPTAMSYMLSDNMTLIDVLGTKHDIPFQSFRNWTMFKSMLETRFRDRPGSDKVSSGHFRILNSKSQDVVLDHSNWAELIKPGMSLVMSVAITKLHRQVQRGRCLRYACLGVLQSAGGVQLLCSQCGLRCYEDELRIPKGRGAPVFGPKDFRAEVEKTRRYLERLERQRLSREQGKIDPKGEKQSRSQRSTIDESIRRELSECVKSSEDRAARRQKQGWMLPGSEMADLRQSIKAMKLKEEEEAAEREKAELHLFLRIHFLPAVFEASLTGTTHDHTIVDIKCEMPVSWPQQSLRLAVRPRRTLVDMVIEEQSAWATTCMAEEIRNGAEIDAVDPLYGTALQVSASIGCLVKTSFLLSLGADPFKESGAWRSAIHAAAMHNHGDVLGLLLKSCHDGVITLGKARIEKMLVFRDACDTALQAATLRGCNAAVLALLNFTDQVRVDIAVCSGDDSTMKIVMGEAVQTAQISLDDCVQILQTGSASSGQLQPDAMVNGKMHLNI